MNEFIQEASNLIQEYSLVAMQYALQVKLYVESLPWDSYKEVAMQYYAEYSHGEKFYLLCLIVLCLSALSLHRRMRRLESLPSNIDFLKKTAKNKKKVAKK